MFEGFTALTWVHTILSIVALITGACVISMLINNRRPDLWTILFFLSMILTDVTAFMFPFTILLPSHYVGILSFVLLALALIAQYALHFAGAARWIYALTMGVAVYLDFFVFVIQLFLKVPALHALAPHAPDNPEPSFAIAQVVLLVIFVFLIWKSVRNFRGGASA